MKELGEYGLTIYTWNLPVVHTPPVQWKPSEMETFVKDVLIVLLIQIAATLISHEYNTGRKT